MDSVSSDIVRLNEQQYTIMLRLQKWLFYNIYIYPVWILVVGFFTYIRFDQLGHLSKYLRVAVFALSIFIEFIRQYFGHYGNLSYKVPELAGFLIISVLMQLPLTSFFLFNPHLLSTALEVSLHLTLWSMIIIETALGCLLLKHASTTAKRVYLSKR